MQEMLVWSLQQWLRAQLCVPIITRNRGFETFDPVTLLVPEGVTMVKMTSVVVPSTDLLN